MGSMTIRASKSAYKLAALVRNLRTARVSLLTVLLAGLLSAIFSFALYTLILPHSTITSKSDNKAPPTPVTISTSSTSSIAAVCARPHSEPDGGDCQAMGKPRRPVWACLSDMETAIPQFISMYRRRPRDRNHGGMRMDHCFALWYILRVIQPKTIIESGAHKGMGTWIMKNAVPNARIISIDPAEPAQRLHGVEYLTGPEFIDFAKIGWDSMNVRAEDSVVFIDDHQNSYKRMFTDNKHRFRRFIIEDNYAFPGGDALSLKTICTRSRRMEWRGVIHDDFSRKIENQSWEEHLKQGRQLANALDVYYEFPPLAANHLGATKAGDRNEISAPIISDGDKFKSLFGDFDAWELEQYRHIAYAEIHKPRD